MCAPSMRSQKEKNTVLGAPVVAFSFNRDFSEAIFSPNNHQLVIVRCDDISDCSTWGVEATLEQHDQSVSATAWHGTTGKILSCAHDRMAYVWYRDSKEKWKPQMVLLDVGVKRGLTCCAWNFSGSKIYVGSADANIAVGRFECSEQWWICRLLTGHTSTVTALAPHPSDDALLASGGADGNLLLVSTYMKKLDTTKSRPFGYVYFEKKFSAWVHAVTWTPSGQRLAVSTHDSRVSVLDVVYSEILEGGKEAVTLHTINMTILPLRALAFIDEDQLVGGGFDYYPVIFALEEERGWRMTGKWVVAHAKEIVTTQQLARAKFEGDARVGRVNMFGEERSRHKNTINFVCCLTALNPQPGAAEKLSDTERPLFATAGLDGRVEVWARKDVTKL